MPFQKERGAARIQTCGIDRRNFRVRGLVAYALAQVIPNTRRKVAARACRLRTFYVVVPDEAPAVRGDDGGLYADLRA